MSACACVSARAQGTVLTLVCVRACECCVCVCVRVCFVWVCVGAQGMVLTIEPGCYFIPALLEPAFAHPAQGPLLDEPRLRAM